MSLITKTVSLITKTVSLITDTMSLITQGNLNAGLIPRPHKLELKPNPTSCK